jgi:hypothetical protein
MTVELMMASPGVGRAGQPEERPTKMRRGPQLALASAVLFCLITLALLSAWSARPALAQATPAEDAQIGAMAGVSLTLVVDTPASNGFVNDAAVSNSQIVTFEIRLGNSSSQSIDDIRIQNILPINNLTDVVCPSCTDRKYTTIERIDEVGGKDVVTVTRELIWSLSGSLPPGEQTSVVFTARILGQAAGPPVENTALVFFNASSKAEAAVSNKVRIVIVPAVPSSAVTQATMVSPTPNWFSSDQGGTMDADWADVDGDGDLDLALASTLGVNVYLNDDGQMKLLWSDPKRQVTYGVRWVDVNGLGSPELVAVGGLPESGSPHYSNSVYRFNPGVTQSPTRFSLMPNGVFTSTDQLIRVETGRFNDDARPDLLVSANALVSECPVYLLYNLETQLFTGQPTCVSGTATAAISPADVDGDGDLDVAVGLFPNELRVLINRSGVLTATNPITLTDPDNSVFVDSPGYFLPYDLAWGDVDNDGDLDLAAAFPLQREVRVYRNNRTDGQTPSFTLIPPVLRTSIFLTPYAIDFGDVDRDGWLDLVVADVQPTIFWNQRNTVQPYGREETRRTQLSVSGERAEVWSIRAVDQDRNGTLEIAIANRSGPSLLLANYAPTLDATLVANFEAGAAGSVAWGDVDGNGFNDLLFGSPFDSITSRLFFNDNGGFSFGNSEGYNALTSIGAHAALLGDVDGGGVIDVAISLPSALRLVINGGAPQEIPLSMLTDTPLRAGALGDLEGDGDLDIALSSAPGPVIVLRNTANGSFSSSDIVTIRAEQLNTVAMDWGDFNGDHYLDLAVANSGEVTSGKAVQIFMNNSDGTFTLRTLSSVSTSAANACPLSDVRTVAWGDVDGDGDLDLAVGNYGAPNCLFINKSGVFENAVAFGGDEPTVAMDWGDWDNDGDLDLAVGHDGAPVYIFANIGARLVWLWQSSLAFPATQMRWGDVDGDGDLDLAMAQSSRDLNSGYFENTLVEPAHLAPTAQPGQLPNQSAYVSVDRPGQTKSAYLYSTSEVLASPTNGVVPVTFHLYHPDGESKPPGVLNLLYEYSLSGGGPWSRATAAPGQAAVVTGTLTREGTTHQFQWDAQADKAIGEHVQFRVTFVNDNQSGALQQASGVGVSPPFQVRATTCYWPAGPVILVNNSPVDPSKSYPIGANESQTTLDFSAILNQGSGVMTFHWDFDDGTTATGQKVKHAFANGAYGVKLTAVGPACPTARPVSVTGQVVVGTGVRDQKVYLPLIGRDATFGAAPAIFAAAAPIAPFPSDPPPLTGLAAQVAADGLSLTWDAATGADAIHIYHAPLTEQTNSALTTTLAGDATSHRAAAVCGVVYTVQPVYSARENEAPAGVYFAPPCDEGGQR